MGLPCTKMSLKPFFTSVDVRGVHCQRYISFTFSKMLITASGEIGILVLATGGKSGMSIEKNTSSCLAKKTPMPTIPTVKMPTSQNSGLSKSVWRLVWGT